MDEEVFENIRTLLNQNLDQDQDMQDDWLNWWHLFMTPEELYFEYMFGGFDNL